MTTVQLKLGPADHGRSLTLDDFEGAEYEPGHKYEIIDGRLWVSYEPDPAENVLENWLLRKLLAYSATRPDVINHVTPKSRVFVTAAEATVPEPDLAAYRDFPHDQALDGLTWHTLEPVLVAEVLVNEGPEKDLVRNVRLYLEVASIREYWVLDGRELAREPTLIQHRRHGSRWVVRTHPFGSTLTTKLLPGFSLLIDPRT